MISSIEGGRVLILGGAGFIGQHLCRALLQAGAAVRCLDVVAPKAGSIVYDLGNEAEWIAGDFLDAECVRTALKGIDYVYHLVSTTLPDTSNKDLKADLSANVLSTLDLLDSARANGAKKVIFVSSGGTVYGLPRTIPIPESHETAPVCGYGIHKLMIEKYLYLYQYNYDLEYCVLRLSNPYGTAQISDRPQGVIGKFVYKILKNEPVEIWGDGSVVRDYIFIEDVIEALCQAIGYQGDKRVFNIGSGIGHSLCDVIDIIEREAGRSFDIRFMPARTSDVPLNILDTGLAKVELGWSARTELRAGVQLMLEYGRQHIKN